MVPYPGTTATLTLNNVHPYLQGKIKMYYTGSQDGWVVRDHPTWVATSASTTTSYYTCDCTTGEARWERDFVWRGTAGTTATVSYEYECPQWIDSETGTGWTGWTTPPQTRNKPRRSRRSRLLEVIRSRHAPAVHVARSPLQPPVDVREMRARETLRRVIGDQKFSLYLKHAFVSVRSPRSGLVYQIFPGHGITKVYRQGTMVERLCVVLQGNFPPTDSLIMRYLMILNDEDHFRSLAVKHSVSLGGRATQAVDGRSLIEIAREIDATRDEVCLDPDTFQVVRKRVFVA